MIAVKELEALRLKEQLRLDSLKTAKERNQRGQFATPPTLSLEIAKHVWGRMTRGKRALSFLDPAIGTGSFFGAYLQAFPQSRRGDATGIELDPLFADAASRVWAKRGLTVLRGDFTRQKPGSKYDVILTNPPYVRHHHLSAGEKRRMGMLVQETTGLRLNGLAGLYCYFLLIAHEWLAEDGIAAWLVPSEFMDVNYGSEVKRYLTEKVRLLQIHRFCPSDVQFEDALVSSAVVVFQKAKCQPGHTAVFSFGGTLSRPAISRAISLDDLRGTAKWTALPHPESNGHLIGAVTLGDLFTVKRGLATGNNDFFIVPRGSLEQLGIPAGVVRPILPSPRYLKQEVIQADASGWPLLDRQLALIDCSFSKEEIGLKWPQFAKYLRAGEKQGIHEGYLASRRVPWYSQEKRDPAPFVCTYMGRNRSRPFRFIQNYSVATAANVYLLLYPKPHVTQQMTRKANEVFAALQAIGPEHFFSQGRVYGGGLHKMEPAELMRLPAEPIAEILGVKLGRQLRLF